MVGQGNPAVHGWGGTARPPLVVIAVRSLKQTTVAMRDTISAAHAEAATGSYGDVTDVPTLVFATLDDRFHKVSRGETKHTFFTK